MIKLFLLLFSPVAIGQIDYSGSTALNLGDDNSRLIQLGFTFNYFDQPFTQAWVSSNGFVSFSTGQDLCCQGYPINDQRTPANTIFGMWTDLISNSNPFVKSTTVNGLSTFTASWINTMEYYNNRSQTFQITFDSTDTFSILYGNTTNLQNHQALAGYTSPTNSYQLYYGSNVGSLSNTVFTYAPEIIEEIPTFIDVGFDFTPDITPDLIIYEAPVEIIYEMFDPVIEEVLQNGLEITSEEIQTAIQEVLAEEVETFVETESIEEIAEVILEEIEEASLEETEEVIAAEIEVETTSGDLTLSELLALIGEAAGQDEIEIDPTTGEQLSGNDLQEQTSDRILNEMISLTSASQAGSLSNVSSQSSSNNQSAQGLSGGFVGSFETVGISSQDLFSQSSQSGAGSIFGTSGYTSELAQTATEIQAGVLSQQSQNDILTLMARPSIERQRETQESEIASDSASVDDINSVDISSYTKTTMPAQPQFYRSTNPYNKTLSDNNLLMYQLSNDIVWEKLRGEQYGR
jgi:hypothetical protein